MNCCRLCENPKELQLSHVVPKFVYNWMKKTGPGRLRQYKQLNMPIQDGIKEYLLCKDCEKLFSIREKWFKDNIFDKYLSSSNHQFENDPKLIYFAISVLWRVLVYFKDDGNNYIYKKEYNLAEKEWREFLFNGIPLKSYKNIHLLFVPEKLEFDKKVKDTYSYFYRAVDIDLAESNCKSFVYAKFSRFIFFGEIFGLNDIEYIGTNVSILKSISPIQEITDGDFIDFLYSRVIHMKSYYDLSPTQQKQNDQFYKDKLEQIKKTDYWNIFKKDKL